MKRTFTTIAALALVVAACGSDAGGETESTAAPTEATTAATTAVTAASTTTAATTTTEASTTTAGETTTTAEAMAGVTTFAITEVVFGDHVTLTNHSDTDVVLDGLWICNRPVYLPLSGTLAPGDSVDVAASDLGGLAQAGGEVGLYTSNDFSNPDDLIDFVTWGTGGGAGGRTTEATTAGLWISGDVAPNDGAAIERTADAGAASSWVSAGEATASLSGLLITEVVFGDHITITNHTDADASLDGMWLCNRPAYVPLSGSLAPGESVEIDAGGLNGLGQAGGEVGLYTSNDFGSSGAMEDYVSWGSGAGRESVAVDAGLWVEGGRAPNDGPGVTRQASEGAPESWISS